MQRTTRLLALTGLMISSTVFSGCENFNLNVNLGGPATEAPTLAAGESNCPAYKPMPAAVKAYLKANNEANAELDPWAGWLLRMRNWLEGGCQ